jgi:hypothetical protein
MSLALLGVDVGFSKSRKTTGLAWLSDGQLGVTVTGSSWAERSCDLPKNIVFDIAALDAPVVADKHALARRGCEHLFSRGGFAKRCRPGLSHHGRGLQLREAGSQAARDFAAVLTNRPLRFGPSVCPNDPIIEAFPNAFMGVLLPEQHFADWSKSRGQAKSDWLYEQIVMRGLMRKLLARLELRHAAFVRRFEDCQHHDERAALICLLTATFAANRNALIIGDGAGGWFWLPPLDLWACWARDALALACSNLKERFPEIAEWAPAARMAPR